MANKNKVQKVDELLQRHKASLIEQLGASAFDTLTPHETAEEIDINSTRIPDLIRQGWLEPAPNKDVGRAHQYYRWRVMFVKQFKQRYNKKDKIPA